MVRGGVVVPEGLSFRAWLDFNFWPGFDADGLSEDEYSELLYAYYDELDRVLGTKGGALDESK